MPFTYYTIYLLGLVPLAIGLWQLKQCLNQRSWDETEGIILQSQVLLSQLPSKSGPTLIILYEYHVGSQKYDSTQFSQDNFSGFIGHCDALVRRYPYGKTVKVFYNPENPEEAVLDRGITIGAYLWLTIGAFFTGMVYAAMHQ